jgi:hypothetical protein
MANQLDAEARMTSKTLTELVYTNHPIARLLGNGREHSAHGFEEIRSQ